MEKFKEKNFFGATYLVGDKGTIINKNTNRVIKSRLNRDGYPTVTLGETSNRRSMTVHRILAIVWIDNPLGLPEVNHKDMNRKNFNLENLEWVTHEDNVKYSAEFGKYKRYGEKNSNYGNTTLKERFEKEPELKKKYARHGSQNGTAIPIVFFYEDMSITFSYIGEFIKWLKAEKITELGESALRGKIDKCLKNNEKLFGKYEIIKK